MSDSLTQQTLALALKRVYPHSAGSNHGSRINACDGELGDLFGSAGQLPRESALAKANAFKEEEEDLSCPWDCGCVIFVTKGVFPPVPSTVVDLTATVFLF